MSRPQRAYDSLVEAYGPQRWWPSVTRARRAGPDEVALGAVLVQHTSWRHVETALRRMRAEGVFDLDAVQRVPFDRLVDLVHPAGPTRVKAKRLEALADHVTDRHGSLAALLRGVSDPRLARLRRRELLGVHGIGRETADAILLYAGGAPLFVVDAYLRRVMRRHGWGDADAPYDDVQRYWSRGLAGGAPTYDEAHALVVRVGVEHCHARRPKCEGCPLGPMLPRGGPRPDT